MASRQPTPRKSLAIPAPGRQPSFEEVACIALTGTQCNVSVCVFCLREEILTRWMSHLTHSSAGISSLELVNSNQATLPDWMAFLGNQSYDVVVFHGAQSEIGTSSMCVKYLKRLVDAVPSGLVVVA